MSCDYVLDLCIGLMYWTYVLDLCIGLLYCVVLESQQKEAFHFTGNVI
jgi:hypothetical protein